MHTAWRKGGLWTGSPAGTLDVLLNPTAVSWDLPTQHQHCQCPPGKPHWGCEGGFLASEVQQLISDLSEVTFKLWTKPQAASQAAGSDVAPGTELWGSNSVPAHRTETCGNGRADFSLPAAKPAGTARGEFHRNEEEKWGMG